MSKKNILLILPLLLAIVSCNPKEPATEVNSANQNTNNSEIIISSFEDYDQLYTTKLANGVFDVSLVSENVTEGNNAMKIEYYGGSDDYWPEFSYGLNFCPTFSLLDAFYDFQFDIADVSRISIDVNNTSEEILYLACALYSSLDERLYVETVRLPAKTAKTCSYAVNNNFIDAKWNNFNRIAFSLIDPNNYETPRVLYFDNLRVSTEKRDEKFVRSYDVDEVLSFKYANDLRYVEQYVTAAMPNAVVGYEPKLPERDYGGVVVHQTGYDGGHGQPNTDYYLENDGSGIRVSKDALSFVPYYDYKYLYVDVYHTDRLTKRFTMGVSDGDYQDEEAFFVKPCTWTTICIELSDSRINYENLLFVYVYIHSWNDYDEYDFYVSNLRFGGVKNEED